MKIDWTKPIIVDECRPAWVIRVFTNNTALVAVDVEDDRDPVMFDDMGNFVGNPDPNGSKAYGSGLKVGNKPEKTYALTLTAEELALVQVLVGNCYGGGMPSSTLYRKLPNAEYKDSKEACPSCATVDVKGEAFGRIVKSLR